VQPAARPAFTRHHPRPHVERVFDGQSLAFRRPRSWQRPAGRRGRFDARPGTRIAIIGSTPDTPAQTEWRTDMALDDDMTTPPEEPDSGTPADRAALGADHGADGGADGGADAGADGGADDGAVEDDPTTEVDEDPRFA